MATKDDSGGGGIQRDLRGVLIELQQNYESDLIIEPYIFAIDSLSSSDSEMAMLKQAITEIKVSICEVSQSIIKGTVLTCTLLNVIPAADPAVWQSLRR